MRVITSKYDLSSEVQIKHAIRKLLLNADIRDINFHTFVPYWKSEGQGELTCDFRTSILLEDILHLFADQWNASTATSLWSNIYLPCTFSLWISN